MWILPLDKNQTKGSHSLCSAWHCKHYRNEFYPIWKVAFVKLIFFGFSKRSNWMAPIVIVDIKIFLIYWSTQKKNIFFHIKIKRHRLHLKTKIWKWFYYYLSDSVSLLWNGISLKPNINVLVHRTQLQRCMDAWIWWIKLKLLNCWWHPKKARRRTIRYKSNGVLNLSTLV